MGGAEWIVLVRADELVGVVSAAGPAARLIESGATKSGLIAELRFQESPGGFVTDVSFDLDAWWTNAIRIVVPGTAAGSQSMDVVLRLQTFEERLMPEAPCAKPVPELDDDGVTVLKCPE